MTTNRRLTAADTGTPRVAVYRRISRDAKRGTEDEGLGVDRQETLCRTLATRRGWTVDESLIFTDNDTSASSGKRRPGWEAMLRAIDADDVDVVLCYALDRLLRRPIELEQLIERCDKHRVRVVSYLGDVSLGDDNPAAETQARIFAAIAAQEARRKGERQVDAEEQARRQGRPPRRRSFGYRQGGTEVDPVEGPAVADGYAWLLAGVSLSEIARRWNARGLRTAFGRSSKPWTGGTVRKVLLNARNCAIRTFRGDEEGPGSWPPIVPEDTYRQAVALLNDPARMTSGGVTVRKHLGGSLYRCGRCGSDVRSSTRSAKQGGTTVYHCRASKHLTRAAGPVDEYVVGVVETRLTMPDAPVLADTSSPELAALHADGRVLRARVRRLETDYADGEIPARVLREQSARLAADLSRIERRVAELTRTSRLAAVVSSPDPVAAWWSLDVIGRQAVLDALMVVTLLPAPSGVHGFDPSTVRIDWR